MIPLQLRPTFGLDDIRRIIAQLDQRLFLPWDIQSLHEALDGGDEGVVSRPEIPVGDGRLASSIANFALEVLEDFAGTTDEGGDHFDASRTTDFGGGHLNRDQEGEEGEKTHLEGEDRRVEEGRLKSREH